MRQEQRDKNGKPSCGLCSGHCAAATQNSSDGAMMVQTPTLFVYAVFVRLVQNKKTTKKPNEQKKSKSRNAAAAALVSVRCEVGE